MRVNTAMKTGIALTEVNELREFGNTLLSCKNLKKVIEITFQKIEDVLSPQVTSLFLFSKDGTLRRVKMEGLDSNGRDIQNDWFTDEHYLPGQSFSGRAAAPIDSASGSPYGETYYVNDLEYKTDSFLNGETYRKKLGVLRCAVSVPLNGTHRTFGTLEVINKRIRLDESTSHVYDAYEDSEICWLTILGGHLSSAISRIRRKAENKLYANISRKLADPDNRKTSSQKVYKSITDQFVGKLTPYKACTIREGHGQKLLVVERSCTSDITFIGKGLEPRDTEGCLVGDVYQNRKHVIVRDIEKESHRFYSSDWIAEQNLKSFIGFPLAIQGESVGTISLFTGYIHDFTKNDIEFLENISYLLAAYIVGIKRASDTKRKRSLFEWNGKVVERLSPEENKILIAATRPEWDFRTIKGISRETKIGEPIVKHVLEKNIGKYIRASLVPSSSGATLYTAISRDVKHREKLALLRTFLSKSLPDSSKNTGEFSR